MKIPEICSRKPRLARTGLHMRLTIDEDAVLPKFERTFFMLLFGRLVLNADFSFFFEYLRELPCFLVIF